MPFVRFSEVIAVVTSESKRLAKENPDTVRTEIMSMAWKTPKVVAARAEYNKNKAAGKTVPEKRKPAKKKVVKK